MMLEGGCLCGEVRYVAEGTTANAAVCHCRNCQRQSGSAFSVLVAVRRADLTVTGKPRCYEDRGESGGLVRRVFCATCGSPLFSELGGAPDTVYLKAGTLDAPHALAPKVHVWCDSAWAWPGFAPTTITFPRNPPG